MDTVASPPERRGPAQRRVQFDDQILAVRSEMGEVVVGVADDLDLDVLAEADGRVSSDLDRGRAVAPEPGRRPAQRGGHRRHAVSEFGRVDLRRLDR